MRVVVSKGISAVGNSADENKVRHLYGPPRAGRGVSCISVVGADRILSPAAWTLRAG